MRIFQILAVVGVLLVSVSVQAEDHGAGPRKYLDLSVDPVSTLQGRVTFKKNEAGKLWPFFVVKGKEYKIQTCEVSCQEALKGCVEGSECEIRAEVEGSEIVASSIKILGQGIKNTSGGAAFTKVSAEGLEKLGLHSKEFGESWRDPSGTVWGDVAKKPDGSLRLLNRNEAFFYCASIGGRLPTHVEFARLRGYLKNQKGEYEPQVLPNLKNSFASASLHSVPMKGISDRPHIATYVFNGEFGETGLVGRGGPMNPVDGTKSDLAVRCVFPPEQPGQRKRVSAPLVEGKDMAFDSRWVAHLQKTMQEADELRVQVAAFEKGAPGEEGLKKKLRSNLSDREALLEQTLMTVHRASFDQEKKLDARSLPSDHERELLKMKMKEQVEQIIDLYDPGQTPPKK